MDCEHERTERKVVKTEYFKQEFAAETDVCSKCGAKLWTKDTHEQFNKWITDLKDEKRDTFVIQYYLSEYVQRCLAEFLKRFPGASTSTIVRAMTNVFLFLLSTPEFEEIAERIATREVYKSFLGGKKDKTSVLFSPMATIDIHSWAQILDMTPGNIVEESILRMLSLQVENDPQLKDFWEKKVLPEIEIIVKSAA